MDATNDDRLLRRAEAAAFLQENGYKVATSTLAKYATVGGGAVFEMFSRFPMYRPRNLLSWAENRLSRPMRSTGDRRTSAAA